MASSLARAAKARQPVNPVLRWTLVASVVASVISLTTGRVTEQTPTELPVRTPPSQVPVAPREPLRVPSTLEVNTLEQAEADPFVLPLPPAAPVPVSAAPPPPAPAPTAPPLSYRYLGQFTDPQGKPKVYIANSSRDVLVEVGTELDEGYRVVAITADEIQLIYLPLQQKASIQIPLSKVVP